jgi:imidazolonepropionase-like amidohydrolase
MPRSTSLLLTTVVILCTALITNAQEAPKPTQAVLAGKLIDVRTGNIRQHAYILIAGDRIQSIADSAPNNIPVTDLSSYTVVPGLIDAHAHTPL